MPQAQAEHVSGAENGAEEVENLRQRSSERESRKWSGALSTNCSAHMPVLQVANSTQLSVCVRYVDCEKNPEKPKRDRWLGSVGV